MSDRTTKLILAHRTWAAVATLIHMSAIEGKPAVPSRCRDFSV
jgi:hypothetical protein